MSHLLASGSHLAVIPTVAAFTIRYFKHKQGQGSTSTAAPGGSIACPSEGLVTLNLSVNSH